MAFNQQDYNDYRNKKLKECKGLYQGYEVEVASCNETEFPWRHRLIVRNGNDGVVENEGAVFNYEEIDFDNLKAIANSLLP